MGIEIRTPAKSRNVASYFSIAGIQGCETGWGVFFAGLTKQKGLRRGELALLTEQEVNALRHGLFLNNIYNQVIITLFYGKKISRTKIEGDLLKREDLALHGWST